MNLFKYPYLIQQEIFHHMETSELFLLSFVSKNMKKLIKSTQMARFKAINTIVYGCSTTNQPYVYIPYKRGNDIIIRIMKNDKNKNCDFQLDLYGKIIDFRLNKENEQSQSYPIALFYLSEKRTVYECIHNYIFDFFGNAVEYYWKEDDYRCDLPIIPKLKNVSFCAKVHIRGCRADPENLETIFSQYPVLKAIQIDTDMFKGTFSPESKFYQTESIESEQFKHNIPDILSHFQGRQAFIQCGKDRNNMLVSDLIKFVNRWKSGEAFQNLEYLRIQVALFEIPQNNIMNGVGAKYVETTKITPKHSLPRV
ncbi:hypothetical protein B9Z55_006579 [Caenorhabditis nigoni]|uniref:F-box domain-containing protein n=3 Tax=Caenorhabditis nigoni TaxID=1611254 RepID=A0A2G5V639_9PELO|nr:hypothetical protein B9Z55_006579 [Caenorhabditis nigoni]